MNSTRPGDDRPKRVLDLQQRIPLRFTSGLTHPTRSRFNVLAA